MRDRHDQTTLDQVLAAFAPTHTTAAYQDLRLVEGGSGLIVLGEPGPDPIASAARLAEVARRTRAALAEHVSWVPFVDAVLVDWDDHPDAGVPTVAPDLLASMLAERPSLDVIAHQRLRTAVEGLEPGWAVLRHPDLADIEPLAEPEAPLLDPDDLLPRLDAAATGGRRGRWSRLHLPAWGQRSVVDLRAEGGAAAAPAPPWPS